MQLPFIRVSTKLPRLWYDIFSPPVASRIYVYPNIAAYEIIAQGGSFNSLDNQLPGFTSIPKPKDSTVNLHLAALIAHIEIGKELIFSEDKIVTYRDSLFDQWEAQNSKEFYISKDYAMEVVDHMKLWIGKDNYAQTRTMSKFTVNTENPSRWQPTPPAYMDGIEPH